MDTIKLSTYEIAKDYSFQALPEKQIVVNTINAYSWVMADKDAQFRKALEEGDVLLPDGVAVVWAVKYLKGEKIRKVAGADLHRMILEELNRVGGNCFYLGSSNNTLVLIKEKLSADYPNVKVTTYSPPYKNLFSEEDSRKMIKEIDLVNPDVLFVGMTAPKQEKWIYENRHKLPDVKMICSIGAVFDFYAGTTKRPPRWMISLGLEWLGRLLSNPKRLWKRYIVYNPVFVWEIIKLKRKS